MTKIYDPQNTVQLKSYFEKMVLCCCSILFACAPQIDSMSVEWTDQQAYLQASTLPIQQAIQTCQTIQDIELNGECVWFVTKSHTERNARLPQPERVRQAFQYCEQSPTEGWKTVCRFDVIDVTGVTGEVADTACSQTGEFQERCMIHALLREEDQLAARFPKGKEVAMMDSIEQRMLKLGLDEVSSEPIHQTLTARVVARRFESAWRNNRQYPFSLRECGGLPESICVDAYRIAIKQIGKGLLPKPCTVPMSIETVAGVGLPVWSDGLNTAVQSAWKSLCHATYGPQKSPDYASSQRAKKKSPFKSAPSSSNPKPQVQPKGTPQRK